MPTVKQISESVARCGLICFLCRPPRICNCRANNHCKDGCFQYACCESKGLTGCWECPKAPCGEGMLAPDKIKIRAFISCIREDGLEQFAGYIVKNAQNGIVYHRDGIWGDYDLESEDAVLRLLRTGAL